MRTGADETRSPKYSHVERERRFLVDPDRLPALPVEHILIEDHYLTDTRFRLRRMTHSADGQVALKLAKKYEAADALARPMVNAYLTEAEYAVFAALPARSIRKRRYALMAGAWTFSVDVFEGALTGLVLAEIEAPDAGVLALIEEPWWAVCEVSQDLPYQGGALATLETVPTDLLS